MDTMFPKCIYFIFAGLLESQLSHLLAAETIETVAETVVVDNSYSYCNSFDSVTVSDNVYSFCDSSDSFAMPTVAFT